MAGGRGARKTSKKGWRRGLDAGGEAGEGAAAGRRRAAAAQLEAVPDAELFVLDGAHGGGGEGGAGAEAAAPTVGRRARRARKPYETSHSLRAHSSGVAGLGNRPAKKLRPAQVQARRQRGQRALQARQGSAGEGGDREGGSNDLWTASVHAEAPPSFPPTLETVTGKKRHGKAKVARTIIDPQGCSYNPTYEAHQDVLAEAVAVEAAKEHKERLSRARWLLEVPPTEAAASGPDRCAGGALGALESDSEGAGGEEGMAAPGAGGAVARKKTRADLNKKKRRKESELKAMEKERTQRATKQIDNLKAIQKEIDKEEEHLEARRRGRTPKEFPRLGRTKYTPAPIQVLATDEVKGSIRALNSCATVSHVVQDALFRSGAVEPRKPVKIPRKKRYRRA